METISLTIDGIPITAVHGQTIMEVAKTAGIYIPGLCADPELAPYGACRLCVVEVEGARGLPTACSTPVADGMVVHTETPTVNFVRRGVVELLISDHPDDCLTCPKNQHCELQKIAAYLGIRDQRFRKLHRPPVVDDSNPFFQRDLAKCILCGKCVRACSEVLSVGAISFVNRGYHTVVSTLGEKPIVQSNCESCGLCVEVCPTGALAPKNGEVPSTEVESVCGYCAVGCGIMLGVRGREIVSCSGNYDSQVNRGKLCAKGRYGYSFVNHPDRLAHPLVRNGDGFVETTWDEALDVVAAQFDKYRGDGFAALSSARCTNEENYLLQKFVRGVMGTNNIDHCARL